MAYFAFRVWAPEEFAIPELLTILRKGSNVFTGVIQDLEQFKAFLQGGGVKIIEVCSLDEHEPITPAPEISRHLDEFISTQISTHSEVDYFQEDA